MYTNVGIISCPARWVGVRGNVLRKYEEKERTYSDRAGMFAAILDFWLLFWNVQGVPRRNGKDARTRSTCENKEKSSYEHTSVNA